MDFKRKLSLLQSAGPGSKPASTPVLPQKDQHNTDLPEEVIPPPKLEDSEKLARIAELRRRIQSLSGRKSSATVTGNSSEDNPVNIQAKPQRHRVSYPHIELTKSETSEGPIVRRVSVLDMSHRHGEVYVSTALDATGAETSTLSLDQTLRDFHPESAVFLDTETTGLAGGTGTIPFLVGLGYFQERKFTIEQYFLADLDQERALLSEVQKRMKSSSAWVTFNGKTFDVPLVRSRFVLSRLPFIAEKPHLDLIHVARRIYGQRLEKCKLGTLERDVLGFHRHNDILSQDVPEQYHQYLRTQNVEELFPVFEHNLWDIIAMVALVGELCARLRGATSHGRFEPSDMTGLAQTAYRAGDATLADNMAKDAIEASVVTGQTDHVRRAGKLRADIHKRQGNPKDAKHALVQALERKPDDPLLHLELAKLYEHRLRDPARALEHARRSMGAESVTEHQRRVERLWQRTRTDQLRLPGMD